MQTLKAWSMMVLLSSFQFFPLNLVIQAWLELGALGYICGEHQPALEVWGRYVRKRKGRCCNSDVEDKDWWRADLHTAVHCSSTECCLNKSVGCSRLCINALKCQRKCWEVLPARITLTEKYHDASLLIKKHGILWISKQHFLNKHMRSCFPLWCFYGN